MCSSPRLFAAYHGLLRTVAPRHPPWTLSRLTIFSHHPSQLPATALRGSALRPAPPRRSRPVFPVPMDRQQRLPSLHAAVSPRPGRPPRVPRSRAKSSLPFPRVVKEQCIAWLRRHAPLVGLVRVELTTSRLSGVRSNHLSYRPRCRHDESNEHRNGSALAVSRKGVVAERGVP